MPLPDPLVLLPPSSPHMSSCFASSFDRPVLSLIPVFKHPEDSDCVLDFFYTLSVKNFGLRSCFVEGTFPGYLGNTKKYDFGPAFK